MKTTDHSVTERFLRYISYDTQSKEEEEQVPSTKKQLEFSILLAAELKEMGISNVRMDGQDIFTVRSRQIQKRQLCH